MDAGLEILSELRAIKRARKAQGSAERRMLDYLHETFGVVERLHVDYKEKQNPVESELAEDDIKNLAKAVSGFANSGGGVLIWGVEDETLVSKPISNVQRFLSKLMSLARQVTDPMVRDIDGDWILSEPIGSNAGYAILCIPESTLPPHRVSYKRKDIQNQYYVRSGESFVVATHAQLEDMFGRRPKPQLDLTIRVIAPRQGWRSAGMVVVGLKNSGRGVARSPYLAISFNAPFTIDRYGIDGNGGFGLQPAPFAVQSRWHKFASSSTVIHSGTTLEIAAISYETDSRRSGSNASLPGLHLEYQLGAEGMQLREGQHDLTAEELLTIPDTAT